MTDNAPGHALSRLDIGAFNCGIAGWINTDTTMHLWIARVPLAAKALHLAGLLSDARYAEHRQGKFAGLRYMDLTKPLPFADRSLSAVFSAHVFEHLFPDEVERAYGRGRFAFGPEYLLPKPIDPRVLPWRQPRCWRVRMPPRRKRRRRSTA